jgi:glycosyltransferase involved in cell wall biosynthesis
MKFSICIPNYNYGKFIGRTIQSVLDQTYSDFEIIVSDNASTDDSAAVVRAFSDPRVRLFVNRCNVGFAGNLDRAARRAEGDFLILLSSDDLLRPDILQTYAGIFTTLGADADSSLISAPVEEIGPDDQTRQVLAIPTSVWQDADQDPRFDAVAGAAVYGLEAISLLRQSVLRMQNPFHFAATAYPRKLYEAVEGYGGGRLMNPDKWFHWRLLTRASRAYYVDRPMSRYRVHNSNQLSQQARSGALKNAVDDYASTFELSGDLLKRLQLSSDDVERAFITHNLIHNAFTATSRGDRRHARRLIEFGKATYPDQMRRHLPGYALRGLLCLGPIGTLIARTAYHSLRKRYA